MTYRHTQTGIEVGVEPVALGNHFALFVEESSDIGTGMAIFKPDASPAIELRIRDEAGNDPLGGRFVRWRNFHQRAHTIPEWFKVEGVATEFLSDFRGLLFLRTEDGSPFAPLGLRFGKTTGSLSAVPVTEITEGGGTGAPPTRMEFESSTQPGESGRTPLRESMWAAPLPPSEATASPIPSAGPMPGVSSSFPKAGRRHLGVYPRFRTFGQCSHNHYRP